MKKPIEISPAEGQEIIQISEIREWWGLTDESPDEFADRVYRVKFTFTSGGPGYVGDLHILQGDALGNACPVVLIRDDSLADEQQPDGYQ